MMDLFHLALDGRTASAREVLRQLKCDRFKQANPKMKIKEEFQFTAKPPYVSIGFVDGSDVSIDLILCIWLDFIKHFLFSFHEIIAMEKLIFDSIVLSLNYLKYITQGAI